MSNQIAQTIYSQLGGSRFKVMTGAKNFVAGTDYIAFQIPRNKAKAKWVKIQLTPADLYKIELSAVRDYMPTTIAERDDVFCDELELAFGEMTGLATSL